MSEPLELIASLSSRLDDEADDLGALETWRIAADSKILTLQEFTV